MTQLFILIANSIARSGISLHCSLLHDDLLSSLLEVVSSLVKSLFLLGDNFSSQNIEIVLGT